MHALQVLKVQTVDNDEGFVKYSPKQQMVRYFHNPKQHFSSLICLYIVNVNIFRMKQVSNKWLIILILTVGTFIGLFKGSEAKQKWVFKIKNRHDEKRQIAEQKKVVRAGGVLLDDIELAAFHRS